MHIVILRSTMTHAVIYQLRAAFMSPWGSNTIRGILEPPTQILWEAVILSNSDPNVAGMNTALKLFTRKYCVSSNIYAMKLWQMTAAIVFKYILW